MSPAGIIHGDYSPFNVMVAPEPPARLAAIVDWDTGTIGDPLIDIGHLLARWTEPGEEPILSELAGGADGYPSRAQMASRYAERSGRDLSALPYYQALALFKLAVILEGTFARQRAAGVARRGEHDGRHGAPPDARRSRLRTGRTAVIEIARGAAPATAP